MFFFRGNENATHTVIDSMPFSVSIVTYMELLQGMRNKTEMRKMEKAFKDMGVGIIPISEEISRRASKYVKDFTLSRSMEMADALIASTCVELNDELYSANDKH